MATVIDPTTDAVDESDEFFVQQGKEATLCASVPVSEVTALIPALSAGEIVNIFFSSGEGEGYQQAYDDQGNKLELSEVKLQIKLKGVGRYKVSKTPTTAPCGVYVNK